MRYDRVEFDVGGTSDQTQQKAFSLGMSYTLNENVSLRAEAHRNRGLAIAYFEYLASNPAGALDPVEVPSDARSVSWGLSVNFSCEDL